MAIQRKKPEGKLAVTLLELLIVVLIISLLATVATGVYSNQAERARIAATHALISNLEMAITRYELDTGSYPPSGSGIAVPPINSPSLSDRNDGSGYLHLALVHSLTGNSNFPETRWQGPYVNLQKNQLRGSQEPSLMPGQYDILDPWGRPLIYVRRSDYGVRNGNFNGGTNLFPGAAPVGANTSLPAPNPFVALGETYYNAGSYQIISLGPDGMSLGSLNGYSFTGAAADDVTNFGY